jgi:hypothetical protein
MSITENVCVCVFVCVCVCVIVLVCMMAEVIVMKPTALGPYPLFGPTSCLTIFVYFISIDLLLSVYVLFTVKKDIWRGSWGLDGVGSG